MVLLTTEGVFPSGRVRLIARHGLCSKRLLVIRGEEVLTKATTPDRNWLSQLLFLKTFRSIVGDAELPPIAAPKPPPSCVLPSKMSPWMRVPVPKTATPAPK